ncbi:MAG: MoxR family ATPase [Candidatus Heimdallarchaeota archaeon]|nr:MoxR family ATPase [Candidatus Heimdallarchaeota archaeon]MDH5646244.1 MoxR family ATPase [Candidatus Heimdallarchaeota archaeon]
MGTKSPSDVTGISAKLKLVKESIAKVVVGQEEVVESVLISILCDGHILLEGAPGLAKTLLVRAIAKVFGLDFSRVQFTPDLMPSDITGVNVYQPSDGTFKFTKGPIFTNFLLADEINRAPPKTQAAMLESMQERQVSSENHVYELPKPFIVLATQNPIEQEGTYPLPEAQVDRFMFKILVDYPTEDEEFDIVKKYTSGTNPYDLLDTLEVVITGDELIEMQKLVRQDIKLSEELMRYLVRVTATTRESEEVTIGASPRASLWLAIGSKANALLDGRDYVNPSDIQRVARNVLRHRVSVSPEWQFEGINSDAIINRVLKTVDIPSV